MTTINELTTRYVYYISLLFSICTILLSYIVHEFVIVGLTKFVEASFDGGVDTLTASTSSGSADYNINSKRRNLSKEAYL